MSHDYAPNESTTTASINRWFWPTELAYRKPRCWVKPFLSYTPRPDREAPPKPNRRGPRAKGPKRLTYCRIIRPFDATDLPF